MHIIEKLHKNLKDGEKLQIEPNGDIFLLKPHPKKLGKFAKVKLASLFKDLQEEIIPLNAKPWITINTSGFEKYRDFGKKEPKVKKEKSYDIDFLVGIFLTLVNSGQKIESGFFVGSDGLKYTTKKVNGMTGYYGITGKLRFIESDGKKQAIPDINSYDLNSVIFKKEY